MNFYSHSLVISLIVVVLQSLLFSIILEYTTLEMGFMEVAGVSFEVEANFCMLYNAPVPNLMFYNDNLLNCYVNFIVIQRFLSIFIEETYTIKL